MRNSSIFGCLSQSVVFGLLDDPMSISSECSVRWRLRHSLFSVLDDDEVAAAEEEDDCVASEFALPSVFRRATRSASGSDNICAINPSLDVLVKVLVRFILVCVRCVISLELRSSLLSEEMHYGHRSFAVYDCNMNVSVYVNVSSA